MSLMVVGSVAFDSIRTPYGEAEEILGGSATYFSVAASWFAPVRVVAVVGEDFQDRHLGVFRERGIDISGLERVSGRTFRWRGEYLNDMSEARTLETQLNVFEQFQPKIPETHASSEFLFLGNIHPELQLHVRRQLSGARLVAADSMNFWITKTPRELAQTLKEVDALIINEGEAKMLSGLENLCKAARAIQAMGPRKLVVKRGEHGVTFFNDGSVFSSPAYLLDEFKDPTGAGDTFAGGFMGHLARSKDLSDANLRRAVVYGSVMASFAVEDFGLQRLLNLSVEEIETRVREFTRLTHFDV